MVPDPGDPGGRSGASFQSEKHHAEVQRTSVECLSLFWRPLVIVGQHVGRCVRVLIHLLKGSIKLRNVVHGQHCTGPVEVEVVT